jgi:hypothetical protein
MTSIEEQGVDNELYDRLLTAIQDADKMYSVMLYDLQGVKATGGICDVPEMRVHLDAHFGGKADDDKFEWANVYNAYDDGDVDALRKMILTYHRDILKIKEYIGMVLRMNYQNECEDALRDIMDMSILPIIDGNNIIFKILSGLFVENDL